MNLITILLILDRNQNFSNLINPLTTVKSIRNSIVMPTISETEVVAAINIVKITSVEHDEVPAHILKKIYIYLSNPYHILSIFQ